MRVLVSGAGGFLGRGLARALAGRHADLSRLVLTDIELPEQVAGAEAVQGDPSRPLFVEPLFDPGLERVFHPASVSGALEEWNPDRGDRANRTTALEQARAALTGDLS